MEVDVITPSGSEQMMFDPESFQLTDDVPLHFQGMKTTFFSSLL